MPVRTVAVGLLVSLILVACGGSDTPTPTHLPTSSEGSSSSPIPGGTPLPSPSGGGFCADRPIIGEVAALVHAGDEPYRSAAAFVTAASKVMRADAGSAPTHRSAYKMRQLALVLNTLRLAILGSVENYPGDFSVRQFTSSLPDRVAEISDEIGCPAA